VFGIQPDKRPPAGESLCQKGARVSAEG